MSGFSFIKQYITKPRTVGAIWPSSKYLARKMVVDINFGTAKCIVEYGPGTGVFTDKILESRNMDTIVILIENNQQFYNQLVEKYKQPNMHIILGSAANLETYLQMHGIPCADYIISGLPFASLPQEVSAQIMAQTKKHLAPGGRFIMFQYTLLKKGFFAQYFKTINIKREYRKITTTNVLTCE